MGNIPQLRLHLIKIGYHLRKGVFGATKRWLKGEGQKVLHDESLQQGHWTVDHIIPSEMGGLDWPENYFLMPKSLNSHFGAHVTNEK